MSSATEAPRRILVVEDEEAIAKGLKFNFELEGFAVELAGDGQSALDTFSDAPAPFDLIVMDLMLPGMSGYEACQEIRRLNNSVPILVLSARTQSEDKAMAFDCGTDQYMTKPFALQELISRARNLIERHGRTAGTSAEATPPADEPDEAQVGQALVNFRTYEAVVDGKTHKLTTMEQQLLRYFLKHDGAVLSRAQILQDVWGESGDITTRSIDNFVLRIRKIIEADPARPQHILSVRGTGYRFVSG